MTAAHNLFKALELIAATKSKNDKLEILKTLGDAEFDLIKRALDPTVSYYVAKVAPAPSGAPTNTFGQPELDLLDRLSSREITGNEALAQIEAHLISLDAVSREILKRIIEKNLKAGIGDTSVNKVRPGLIPVFPYMRCSLPKDSNIHKWDWTEGVYSQEKADGMFANATTDEFSRVTFSSRQGNPFPRGALVELEDTFKDLGVSHMQMHGELLVYENGELLPREKGNGILNSLLQGGDLPRYHRVAYEAWDMIPAEQAVDGGKYEVPYWVRIQRLRDVVQGSTSNCLQVIETETVFHHAEAMAHYKRKLAQGREGTILKHANAIWRDGDSKDQVKFKLEVDVDLKIVGFLPGEGKNEATFGSIVCRTEDDLLEVSVSGFTDAKRKEIHEQRESIVGKIMAVRANQVMTPSGESKVHSLFLPRHVEIRSDKKQADTLQRVLDQFKAAVEA